MPATLPVVPSLCKKPHPSKIGRKKTTAVASYTFGPTVEKRFTIKREACAIKQVICIFDQCLFNYAKIGRRQDEIANYRFLLEYIKRLFKYLYRHDQLKTWLTKEQTESTPAGETFTLQGSYLGI